MCALCNCADFLEALQKPTNRADVILYTHFAKFFLSHLGNCSTTLQDLFHNQKEE